MAATKSAGAPPPISILTKKIRPIDMYSILRIRLYSILRNIHFINKRRDKVKLLHWQGSGYLLYYKRLEKGTFELPRYDARAGSITLSYAQLVMIMDGLSIKNLQKRIRYTLPETPVKQEWPAIFRHYFFQILTLFLYRTLQWFSSLNDCVSLALTHVKGAEKYNKRRAG